jgi:selenocysteine lyase/cysteine desulfurase
LTHLSHRLGLVPPIREIAAMARACGIATIVDAAHSWCQLDMTPISIAIMSGLTATYGWVRHSVSA